MSVPVSNVHPCAYICLFQMKNEVGFFSSRLANRIKCNRFSERTCEMCQVSRYARHIVPWRLKLCFIHLKLRLHSRLADFSSGEISTRQNARIEINNSIEITYARLYNTYIENSVANEK